ncbi:rod shape-determining protein MreD [Fluviicola taffensis DSM 16823]|uniref:Rod shape-determining protein MreD n=1 Tax=Fluviicola taffensis (strain DSM 16823 / NCIMB 13979 / RW262) TaxID=755732 RepID=F2IJ16_FLUTR|nr:rod shape-determining protein MreD [Fluviicola taffensis DSM 16823]
MNSVVLNSIRFVLFVLFQVLILNNIEPGFGIYPMIYPLFIFMLPFQLGTVPLMLLSFIFGLVIDSFSNTFGLHASSAVIMAFFRPLIFKWLSPRDGYESVESVNVYSMGGRWFLYAYGTLLLIHNTWFFFIESFKLNEFLWVLLKIGLSVPTSFILSLLVQFIFVSNKKEIR